MLFKDRFRNFKDDLMAFIEHNRLKIFPFIILLIFEASFLQFKLWETELFSSVIKQSFHFNVLSINSILAGFLFTGLSIMISVSNKKIIKLLNRGGYLKIIDRSIYLGIFAHIFSIIMSFVSMINSYAKFQIFFTNLEFASLLIGVTFFFMAILKLKTIVEKIREEDLKEEKNKQIDIKEEEVSLIE